MSDRIPIQAAKDIAKRHGLRQVILVAWDGERSHVVTYGKSVEDCDQAARGGNFVKKALGWPESLCNEEPSRVKKLKARIAELENENCDMEIALAAFSARIKKLEAVFGGPEVSGTTADFFADDGEFFREHSDYDRTTREYIRKTAEDAISED